MEIGFLSVLLQYHIKNISDKLLVNFMQDFADIYMLKTTLNTFPFILYFKLDFQSNIVDIIKCFSVVYECTVYSFPVFRYNSISVCKVNMLVNCAIANIYDVVTECVCRASIL